MSNKKRVFGLFIFIFLVISLSINVCADIIMIKVNQTASFKDGDINDLSASDYASGVADVGLGGDGQKYRAIIDFNTSSIPAGATINNITLELTQNGARTANVNITGIGLSTTYADAAAIYSACFIGQNYSTNIGIWNG